MKYFNVTISPYLIKVFVIIIFVSVVLIITIYPVISYVSTFNEKYSDEKIRICLNSSFPNDLAMGAFQAGESGKKEWIPLLLKNAFDSRRCTNIRFARFTVYQEKMSALQKIMKLSPPVEIEREPDSTVIKFYVNASSK